MDMIPSIAGAHRVIEDEMRNAGVPDPPPTVIDVLACYSEQDGFEIFAVVDGEGGRSFPLGADMPAMMTVNRRLGTVASLMTAWIGESVMSGRDRVLVACRSGGHMPSIETCRQALDRYEDIEQFGRQMRAAVEDISSRLRLTEEKISAVLVLFVQFDELADAVSALGVRLNAVSVLWQRLDELTLLPNARRVDTFRCHHRGRGGASARPGQRFGDEAAFDT